MDLFHTLDDLKPFVFRIVDNGGETADRYTVATCDGEYMNMSSDPYSPQGVCLNGSGLDPLHLNERIEAGLERDIRWIDLPADCRRAFFEGTNDGMSDWLGSLVPPTARDDADDPQQMPNPVSRIGAGIYGAEGSYRIRRDDPSEDGGPFPSVREAVLATLPDDCDMCGPEFHTATDIWEQGEPDAPWDRSIDPPRLESGSPFATHEAVLPDGSVFGFFASDDDARSAVDREPHATGLSVREIDG